MAPSTKTNTYRRDLLSGIGYTALSKYTSVILRIGISAILARMLSPNDFGIAGIALVFINFCAVISVSGISPAIVQNQDLTDGDIENIFSFSFYLAVGSATFVIVCSPLVGHFYHSAILSKFIVMLSAAVFFSILTMVPNAMVLRDKNFKFIATRTIIVEVFAAMISLGGIYAGAGIYTLAIMPIASAICMFVLTFRQYRIRLPLTFRFASMRKIMSFSLNQIGFNICNYCYRNIDKLLLGKFLGMSELGYYDKANHVVMLPINNVALVVSPVLHPLWAKFQTDKDQIKEKYLQITRILAFIGFPIAGISFFSAREIILCLFGPNWEASVPIFRIFSLNIGILIVQSAVGSAFQALNHTRELLIGAIFSTLAVSAFLTVGIALASNLAIVICITCSFFVIFAFYHSLLFYRCLKLGWAEFLYNLRHPILFTLAISGAAFVLNYLVRIENLFLFATVKFAVLALLCLPALFYFVKKIKLD